jgi:flagellar biosynthesis/type III secretory pathway M-ring protein FliF/YscJ
MAFANKKINFDFEKIINKVKDYFLNLGEYEKYAWIAIGVGIILIITSIIIW